MHWSKLRADTLTCLRTEFNVAGCVPCGWQSLQCGPTDTDTSNTQPSHLLTTVLEINSRWKYFHIKTLWKLCFALASYGNSVIVFCVHHCKCVALQPPEWSVVGQFDCFSPRHPSVVGYSARFSSWEHSWWPQQSLPVHKSQVCVAAVYNKTHTLLLGSLVRSICIQCQCVSVTDEIPPK